MRSTIKNRITRNFYGRVHGKTLKAAQRQWLAEDLPALRLVAADPLDNPDRIRIDPEALPGTGPLWLEIGFGGGEHMVALAGANPQLRYIGCEPFINGVAMALGRIRAAGLRNILLHPGDARDLFDVLPDGCIARAFLNYPDPWPKTRHHRRRFVTPEHLQPLARVMAPGARFHLATDIADYVRQALDEVPKAGFELVEMSATPWQDWVSTRYEAKALREGRAPRYLTFRRAGSQPGCPG